MKRPSNSSAISSFRFLAIVLLAAWVILPAFAQQDQSDSGGVVDVWLTITSSSPTPAPWRTLAHNRRCDETAS